MPMRSNVAGKNISTVEVTNISLHGIWLLVKDREFFLPYSDFPWFKDAKVSAILDVKLLNAHHLFWPQLDVDIERASIEDLTNYPLVYK
jgi:hypothetical protein